MKSLAPQSFGQESLSAGGHAALAGQVSARGFSRSRSGRCVARVHVLVLRGPDLSALSPPGELSGSGGFWIQRGSGVLMAVAVFSGALRPARPPEDAGFGGARVAHHGSILRVASAVLFEASQLGAAPLRERRDLAERRVGPLQLDLPGSVQLSAGRVSVLPADVGAGQRGRHPCYGLTIHPVGVEEAGVSRVRLAPRVNYISAPRAGGRRQAVGGRRHSRRRGLTPRFAPLFEWNVRCPPKIVNAAVLSAELPVGRSGAARRAVVVVGLFARGARGAGQAVSVCGLFIVAGLICPGHS